MATPRAVTPSGTSSVARKALHAGSAVAPVAYARFVDRHAMLLLLGTALAAALAVEMLRARSPWARLRFEQSVGHLLKAGEHDALTGATWLAASLFGAVLFLPRTPAIAVLWCVTVGDPTAAVAGMAWKALRGDIVSRGRTLAGSLAMAVICAVGLSALVGYSALPAMIVAVTAAIAERCGGRIDDNVTIACGTAFAALALT